MAAGHPRRRSGRKSATPQPLACSIHAQLLRVYAIGLYTEVKKIIGHQHPAYNNETIQYQPLTRRRQIIGQSNNPFTSRGDVDITLGRTSVSAMNARISFVGLLVAAAIAACSTITPHENFKSHMAHHIGRSIEDPNLGWRRAERLIDRHPLPNGHIEEAYRFRGTCRYFFEIDPATKRIVSWHFEGSEHDCEIPS